MKRLPFFLLTVALVVFDQLAKLWAARNLILGNPQPLIGSAVRLTRVHNAGGAFGIFPGNGEVFVAVSVVISLVLAALLLSRRLTSPVLRSGLAIILAGAIGNLIDRLIHGYVLDFFEIRGFPVFNVADACVTVGAMAVIYHVLFASAHRGDRPKAD